MKIQITKFSSPGFQEEFSTVNEALVFFRDRCICGSCKVTQSQFVRPEGMSDEDYEYERNEFLWDEWDKHGDWEAIRTLWATPCGCEYGVDVIDE